MVVKLSAIHTDRLYPPGTHFLFRGWIDLMVLVHCLYQLRHRRFNNVGNLSDSVGLLCTQNIVKDHSFFLNWSSWTYILLAMGSSKTLWWVWKRPASNQNKFTGVITGSEIVGHARFNDLWRLFILQGTLHRLRRAWLTNSHGSFLVFHERHFQAACSRLVYLTNAQIIVHCVHCVGRQVNCHTVPMTGLFGK
jgi:hypothetical protein